MIGILYMWFWVLAAGPPSLILIAILKAFEQITDLSSIPYVKKLVASAKDRRIHRAARDCLPFLAARCGRDGPPKNRETVCELALATDARKEGYYVAFYHNQ